MKGDCINVAKLIFCGLCVRTSVQSFSTVKNTDLRKTQTCLFIVLFYITLAVHCLCICVYLCPSVFFVYFQKCPSEFLSLYLC